MSADYYRQLAEKATELLGDGEWHQHEKIMRALMKLVPPGPALRRSEQDRLAWLRQRGREDAPRKRERATEDQVYSGQRAIVRDFLHNKGVFETNKAGSPHGGTFDRQIRMVGRHKLVAEGHAADLRAKLEAENRDLRRELSEVRGRLRESEELVGELRDCLTHNGLRDQATRIIKAYKEAGLVDAASRGRRGRR